MSLVDLGKRLLDAAKRGETDEVRQLMSNGAPFTTDWLGTSPLHFSAQYGHVSTAEVLLRAGISRDARTKVDRTPLHVAAFAFNHFQNLERLGTSPLHFSAQYGHVSTAEVLLRAGISRDARTKVDRTPLLVAAQEGHVAIVDLLLQHAADIDAIYHQILKKKLGTSPLHFSAQYGHVSTAEVLLRAGISRDARTKVDRTPLHVAAQEGHVAIVDLLLQHAADIDAKDMLKMTPLHWATEKGHMGVIETLLKANADVQCENKFDRTPLDIAIINGRPDIVQTLQLAQHTAVGNLQPTETVTIETSQIDVNTEGAIIDGSEGISMEEHTIVSDTDEGNILLQNMQQIKTEAVDDVTEDEGNSTSVLATLAALAEATAQNTTANSNTTDAINWLESQGITMISTADGNIITSAVESGQTISLTEAGKIALNIIKQQGLATEDGVLSNVVEEGEEDKDESQKVITYVTSDGGEIHQDTEGLHITSVATIGGEEAGDMVIHPLTEIVEEDEPEVKRARLTDDDDVAEVSTVIDVDSMLQKTGSGDATTLVDNSDVEEIEREKLRKELEDFKRQAEEFKEQLKQKDRDLEEYKKQLGEISDKSDDVKDS